MLCLRGGSGPLWAGDLGRAHGSVSRILQVEYANGRMVACFLAKTPSLNSEEDQPEQASVRRIPLGALELDTEAWKKLNVVFVNEASARSFFLVCFNYPRPLTLRVPHFGRFSPSLFVDLQMLHFSFSSQSKTWLKSG